MGLALLKENYDDLAIDLFEDLKTWMKPLANLQKYKDDYTLREMNVNYVNFMLSYKRYRDEEIEYILSNKDYYNAVRQLARKSTLFDMLIDGYAIEVNRAKGQDRFLPIIPYPEQLKLIEAYDGDKSIIVEKSRRAGASLLMSFFMRRGLIHKTYHTMLTSHQDEKHLDRGKNDRLGNSTFGRIEYMMSQSIFVEDDWKDDRKYNTKERISNATSIKRDFKSITYKTNSLIGVVLGKGTGVGDAVDEYYSDEFEVVCDKFPNQADNFLGAVAPAVERVFIYSTYRSVVYPMYQLRLQNDTSEWDFIRLRWEDNPTCNKAWYKWQSAKLGNAVAVARELGIDPAAAITGRVFKALKNKFFIPEEDFIKKFGNIWDKEVWLRAVGGDNGADQNYTLAFIHKRKGIIYYYKNQKVEDMSPGDVTIWAKSYGFEDAVFYVDEASKANHGFKDYAITSLLLQEGLNVQNVENRDLLKIHSIMRMDIKAEKVWINKDDMVLSNSIKAYRYDHKTQWVKKDEASHVGDGCTYLYKGAFYMENPYYN